GLAVFAKKLNAMIARINHDDAVVVVIDCQICGSRELSSVGASRAKLAQILELVVQDNHAPDTFVRNIKIAVAGIATDAMRTEDAISHIIVADLSDELAVKCQNLDSIVHNVT